MSHGPRYKSELDAIVSQSVRKIEGAPMTSENIVDLATGLVAAASPTLQPPYRIICPAGTNLGEHEEGENVTLEQRLKDIEGVEEVVVGKGRGLSIDHIDKT